MTISIRTITLMLIALSLAMTGCSSVKKKRGGSYSSARGSSGLQLNGDSDSSTAGGLSTIHFGFNSAVLSERAKSALSSNAEFLRDNSGVHVQIEGHCDERGGIQYNLALGEKRAMVTKDYLVSMGVSSSRISIISFGKERPVAFGHSESAWGKNRRSNFVVTAK